MYMASRNFILFILYFYIFLFNEKCRGESNAKMVGAREKRRKST